MKQAKSLTYVLLTQFKKELAPLKGQPYSKENEELASHIIRVFTGQLQMLDLTLGQKDALAVLQAAYKSI